MLHRCGYEIASGCARVLGAVIMGHGSAGGGLGFPGRGPDPQLLGLVGSEGGFAAGVGVVKTMAEGA